MLAISDWSPLALRTSKVSVPTSVRTVSVNAFTMVVDDLGHDEYAERVRAARRRLVGVRGTAGERGGDAEDAGDEETTSDHDYQGLRRAGGGRIGRSPMRGPPLSLERQGTVLAPALTRLMRDDLLAPWG
jgi:hypothetical protein